MINPDELKPEHKNRLVAYTPDAGSRPEQGRITSWNEKFIFVDYDNTARGQATTPSKLDFVYG